jgi:hypothetical protein
MAMRASCAVGTPLRLNCGLTLGGALSQEQAQGRDKVTILAPPRIAAFSLWAEQLIAESTGKEGCGLIPVGGEPIGDPAVYAGDRLFVALRLGAEAGDLDREVERLVGAGLPVVVLELRDVHDLAAEFFRWEFATAVAAVPLGIDPFDEPNVKESKDNTRTVLAGFEATGTLSEEKPSASSDGLRLYGGAAGASVRDALLDHLGQVRPGDYVATMAYIDPTARNDAALAELRTAIRDAHRVATTVGFGPRFLHSTGQLHKGGPNTGVYLQLTADDRVTIDIPGQSFGFGTLIAAQAEGDLRSLRSHGRRVIRIHAEGEVTDVIGQLTRWVRDAAAASPTTR